MPGILHSQVGDILNSNPLLKVRKQALPQVLLRSTRLDAVLAFEYFLQGMKKPHLFGTGRATYCELRVTWKKAVLSA